MTYSSANSVSFISRFFACVLKDCVLFLISKAQSEKFRKNHTELGRLFNGGFHKLG